MRFSVPLHKSRRHHILKSRTRSSYVTFLWFFGVLIILFSISAAVSIQPLEFLSNLATSFLRTSVAYCFALVLALALALLITSTQILENTFLPIFDSLQSFPSFALFPLLTETLQKSPESVIISVLVITMIWPILFTLISAMKNRRESLEEAATIFGATGVKRLTAFTLPQLWPAIVTGSIVGWGEGWEFIIGAELLVNVQHGIGQYFGHLGQDHQSTILAVGIVLLMLFLFEINKILWLPLLDQATHYESE